MQLLKPPPRSMKGQRIHSAGTTSQHHLDASWCESSALELIKSCSVRVFAHALAKIKGRAFFAQSHAAEEGPAHFYPTAQRHWCARLTASEV